jgi:hypothetical protein
MSKQNPISNSYYWRAVKRLAKQYGISIPKARKLDWQKEARAEQKRRSQSRLHPPQVSRRGTKVPTYVSRTPPKRRIADTRKRAGVVPPRRAGKVPTGRVGRELDLSPYDRIRMRDDEEYEQEEDAETEWEEDWSEDWKDLNDLDDVEGFMDDFEHESGDKYKEPA